MALRKIKLGEVLVPFKEKCGISNLSPFEVSGINRDKEFFEPSKQVGEDTTNYQNVPPGYFACNLMHVGRDVVLPIAYNHTETVKHVSPAYSVFRIKDDGELLDLFFFMYLKSDERDRLFWFFTDSSIRDGMTWDDFCEIEIEVPDIPTQLKYVKVYKAMLENLKAYETGLNDLKLLCDGMIEKARKDYDNHPISDYCYLSDETNDDESCLNVKGLTVYKQFIDTKADMNGVSLKNYKVVNRGDIGYVPTTNRNGDKIACGLSTEKCIVSSTYEVLRVRDKNILYPEYLFLWFMRKEMDRYARYNSWGSAREVISWEDLGAYKIPVPPIEKQKAIVDIYNCYIARKPIKEALEDKIRTICPVLIKGSVEEARES